MKKDKTIKKQVKHIKQIKNAKPVKQSKTAMKRAHKKSVKQTRTNKLNSSHFSAQISENTNIQVKKLLFLETGRKATHIIFGSTILVLIYLNLIWLQGIAILIALALAASIISTKIKIPGIHFLLRNFERAENLHRFPGRGVVFFLLGILLSLILFDKDIALASIAILTFGDAVASFFNITHGTIQHPFAVSKRKLVEGSVAGTIAGFLAAALFINWKFALIGSIVGMLFEAMEIKINNASLDDNVIVPVTAGAAMALARLIF